ncbi:glycosyltransferase involved in cell wall biosynthesis [Salinibacter ruber]|uniref:glycosyltransferase family 4 protein n=1 Tax=Salinibacter ruber TaxID=146919 RepID=UPI00216759BE|nr:glycosyltransferase [Salinibacter ruber]MCS3955377.1 glycosyltransferase involved in cell wall biosynthesis [Salinibacter ruber]
MKVAFHFENSAIPDADLREPELGNPGIGGTEFLFAALPHYLAKLQHERVEPRIYAHTTGKLPESVETRPAASLKEAVEEASRDGADFIVFDPKREGQVLEAIPALEEEELRGIAWANNVPSVKCLRQMSRSKYVSRFVAAGREMLDRLIDHSIYEKSTYIFNGFDTSGYEPEKVFRDGEKVVFLGSITTSKGFHILAKKWKKIKNKVPSAELIVIGAGNLYESGVEMGRWGIAEEEYEKIIREHLQGEDGDPVDSVTFKGLMGTGKNELLRSAAVGIVNPSGKSENCPASAIEFQACGTPVVSRDYRGLLDTVKDGETGLLGRVSDLVDNTVHLLKNEDKSLKMGERGVEFVKEKFSYKKVCERWLYMLNNVGEGKNPSHDYKLKNLSKDLKLLREMNRNIKKIPILKNLPSVYETTRFAKRLYK